MVLQPDVSILVADDDAEARGGIFAELERLGLSGSLFQAASFEDLKVRLAATPRALLVLDVRFGHQNGLQQMGLLLRRAKRDGRRLAVLMVSALPGAAVAVEARQGGAFRYLAKPVQPAPFEAAVRDALADLATDKPQEAPPAPGESAGPLPAAESDSLEALGAARAKQSAPPQELKGLQQDPLELKVVPGRRHRLERDAVYSQAPEEPGVLTLFDKNGEPVFLEWTDNLQVRLAAYVDQHPRLAAVARVARTFEMVPTEDRDEELRLFNRLVEQYGKPPSKMTVFPDGALTAPGTRPR